MLLTVAYAIEGRDFARIRRVTSPTSTAMSLRALVPSRFAAAEHTWIPELLLESIGTLATMLGTLCQAQMRLRPEGCRRVEKPVRPCTKHDINMM
jgi:hypothetical protein